MNRITKRTWIVGLFLGVLLCGLPDGRFAR